jgi:hypothetical protein
MKRNPKPAEMPEPRPNPEEMWRSINRRMSDAVDGWTRCKNTTCRRQRRCCGDGLACRNDRSLRRSLTHEERAKASHDLRVALEKRKAELAAGAQPLDLATSRQLRKKLRIKARRKAARKQAYADKAAPTAPQAAEPPAPAAYQPPPLSPEQQARIDRAWNDYVASLPKEDATGAGDHERERRPRITQL